MIVTEIETALNESTAKLFREIGRFTPHSFNLSPGPGWSAGQVTEHILLTDIAVFRVLQGELSFAGRKSDEKLPLIQAALVDRSRKLEATSAATPSDLLKDPFSLQEKIMRERNSIIQFLNTIEEDSLCVSRPHRFLGDLTITEWVWFLVYHTDRHIEQIKQIQIDAADE